MMLRKFPLFAVLAFHLGPSPALAASPLADDASLQGVRLDLAANRTEAGLTKAAALLEKFPQDARLHETKGRLLHQAGRYDEAVESYFDALKLDPKRDSCHFHLGEAAFAQQFWPEAIEFYQVHAAKTKGAPRTILKLVYCHIANGNLNEASRWLGKLDPFDDSFPGYYFGKAAFVTAMGKTEESNKLLQQARTLYGNAVSNEFEVEMLQIFKKSSPSKDPARPRATAP
jgi:tetratricopeptide (TPR) repeat protein